MAKKEFTAQIGSLSSDDHIANLYEIAGAKFPIVISSDAQGNIVSAEYDTEWQEGSTKPSEGKNGEIEYVADYKKHSLTKKQTDAIDKYITENLGDK